VKSQRQKGAQFEREVATYLSNLAGQTVERHLGQARDGGEDIDALGITWECKRRKSLRTLYAWMDQAARAWPRSARELFPTPVPAVVLRADNEEALVVVRLADLQEFTRRVARAMELKHLMMGEQRA
jgi:hypothetical protein